MKRKSGTPAKKRAALGKTQEITAAEQKFYTCPGGHRLPHETNRGNCSPLKCAESFQGPSVTPLGTKRDNEVREVDRANKLSAIRMEIAKSRLKRRRELVPVPNLEGKEAEDWSTTQIVNASPKAVAELLYQLDYGDDDQRIGVARDILDANGMRKKESIGGGAPSIIILNGASIQNPPWEVKDAVRIGSAATQDGRSLPTGKDHTPTVERIPARRSEPQKEEAHPRKEEAK